MLTFALTSIYHMLTTSIFIQNPVLSNLQHCLSDNEPEVQAEQNFNSEWDNNSINKIEYEAFYF